ncbi:MAG: AAA family ATPase [Rhizobiales bacterium]|nr:AAA family ATPase [Hyphomicrobiales bacterium]
MTGAGDIAAFLAGLGLEKYVPVFAENEVDLAALAHLSEDDLKELGLPLGPRRKIAAALRDVETAPAAAAPAAAAPEGERRVAAVLFADLVGYTALTNRRDAEDIHTLLQGFFAMADRLIEEYGGRVDKHIGDCVMGVFGAPKAHGNDTERAVRAALAIRDAMKPLSLELKEDLDVHVGIAAGHVIASSTGSAVHSEYTVTGDTVNLASRLAGEAGAGEVVVSDGLWQGLAQKLEGTSLGRREIDGFRGSQEIWRVTGWHGAQAVTPMIGRRLELQQLRSVLEACRDSGRGSSILIRGEAGIGKTRFMEEIATIARGMGFHSHSGLVLDFGAGADAIQTLARAMLEGGTGANDAEDQVFINELTGTPQPPEMRLLLDAMDIPTREQGLRQALSRLIERESRDQPLLLAVEDLHWAKRHTLNSLAVISAAVSQCPAILIMTSRFENDPIDHAWRAQAGASSLITIDLAPLNSAEAVALATPFLAANAEFARLCIERAAGNPLFLDQLLKNMVEGESFSVPPTIQSLVQARLDRLDPASKAIVQAASVLGQRFDEKALGHMLGSSGAVPDSLLGKFIVPQQGPGFMFQHALIRDAVYGSLLKSRKSVLHRRAADWFEKRDPEVFAEHLDLAEAPEAPAAYLAAARAHVAAYRYDQALRAVSRGLELAKADQDRFALLKLKGDILHDTGKMPDALACFDLALSDATNEADRCRSLIGRAQVKRVIDDLDGAFADLAAAEPIAVGEGLKAEEARLRFLRGNLYFPRGDIDGCVREHTRSLELAREAESVELETAALGGLADAAYIRGRLVTAYRLFSDCVRLSQEHGLHRTEVANRPMAAIAGWYAGKAEAALREAEEAVSSAARIGHHRAETIGQHAAWFLSYSRGELAAALTHAERALILARQIKARRFEAEALAFRGETLRAMGQRAGALADLRQALEISHESGMAYMGPIYFGLLARATDDAKERAEALKSAEELLPTSPISHNHLIFRMVAIDASLESGNWDEAERYAADLEAYTAPEPSPWADFYVARGRLLAQAGRGDVSEELKAKATALIEQAKALGLDLAAKELKEVLRLLPLAGEEGTHVT